MPSKEEDGGYVVVETVTPNSPAAAADLQRGDRLIAIGGEQSRHLFVCFLKNQ